MTQLNTPYPATAYLTGFLRQHQARLDLEVIQADPAIELFLRLFSRDGMGRVAMTKAQAERDDATKAATEARERAAGLAGQLQAMQEQNAALLAAIKPQGEPKPKKTPPAKA